MAKALAVVVRLSCQRCVSSIQLPNIFNDRCCRNFPGVGIHFLRRLLSILLVCLSAVVKANHSRLRVIFNQRSTPDSDKLIDWGDASHACAATAGSGWREGICRCGHSGTATYSGSVWVQRQVYCYPTRIGVLQRYFCCPSPVAAVCCRWQPFYCVSVLAQSMGLFG